MRIWRVLGAVILAVAIIGFISQARPRSFLHYSKDNVIEINIQSWQGIRSASEEEIQQITHWLNSATYVKPDKNGGRITTPDGQIIISLKTGEVLRISLHPNGFVLYENKGGKRLEFIAKSKELFEFLKMLENPHSIQWQ